MKYILINLRIFRTVFSSICIFIVSVLTCYSQTANDAKGETDDYKLIWADEFNLNGTPDSSNWNFERGFVRNRELQWYQQENAYCRDGKLIIEARNERKKNPDYLPESDNWRKNREYAEYTSSSLLTRGLHSWMFGRFEMRAKIDTRPGLWPAFWTLGVSGSWPHNGEIDIMEYYKGRILANIAWGAEEKWQPVWDDFRLPVDSLKAKNCNWTDKFHIWRMDWDKESIRLFLDDVLLNEADLSLTFNRDGEGRNPFLQPHYIIINLAIGGTAGGDPSDTRFPAYYVIDYIRVYQK